MTDRGIHAEILVTERPGHARELAAAAVARGATHVIAWGGDGTINDVAAALVFRETSLGIVPSGSGNGLARELGVPWNPASALTVALDGRLRSIDCGELDGRLFVNVAGVGLDARVAHQFAAHGLVRRGFMQYVRISMRELLRFEAHPHTIVAGTHRMECRCLLVAIANARQYGNGAVIAPDARIDDGRLDIVVVEDRSLVRILARLPDLFRGRLKGAPGVTMLPAETFEIRAAHQVLYHLDGEPFVGAATIRGRVLARALRVRVPLAEEDRSAPT